MNSFSYKNSETLLGQASCWLGRASQRPQGPTWPQALGPPPSHTAAHRTLLFLNNLCPKIPDSFSYWKLIQTPKKYQLMIPLNPTHSTEMTITINYTAHSKLMGKALPQHNTSEALKLSFGTKTVIYSGLGTKKTTPSPPLCHCSTGLGVEQMHFAP